ncbi:MAG: class II aldolase/adducin family protein [Steroidobacteraceae bacterium]
MTMLDETAAAAVVSIAKAMDEAGLAPNKSGNVSCRDGDGFLITPSGVPYRDLVPADVARLDATGDVRAASRRPSSEWRMHAAIYRRRTDVQAIVHTHSPNATALACAHRGLPAFHYMIALAGGDVRCAPYATFGSDELAAHAVTGLEGRRATLLANHGVVAVGASLSAALAVAVEIENMSRQFLALLAAGLEPRILDEAEMARVIEKFKDYGR